MIRSLSLLCGLSLLPLCSMLPGQSMEPLADASTELSDLARMVAEHRTTELGDAVDRATLSTATSNAATKQSPDRGPWRFALSPSFFLPMIDGTASVGIGGDIESDFGDGWGIVGRAEIWYERFGLVFDAQHYDVNRAEVNTGPLRYRNDVEQTTLDLKLAYRLVETGFSGENPHGRPAFTLDFWAGARYSSLKQHASAPFVPSFERREDWVSPVVGLRAEFNLSDCILLGIDGDVAGFTVGEAGWEWNVSGGLGFRLTEWFTLKVGYRAYGVDFERGSGLGQFRYDTTVHGPWAGFTLDF